MTLYNNLYKGSLFLVVLGNSIFVDQLARSIVDRRPVGLAQSRWDRPSGGFFVRPPGSLAQSDENSMPADLSQRF